MELENRFHAAGGTVKCTVECAMEDCDAEFRCKWGDPDAEGVDVEDVVGVLRRESGWVPATAIGGYYAFICPDCV